MNTSKGTDYKNSIGIMNLKNRLTTMVIAGGILTAGASTPVYLDPKAPIEDRVEDALKRMTMEEKVAMCHAQSKFSSPGVPRLGIPEIWMSDGPHGVRAEISWNSWAYADWTNDSITAFPALTALAATWNPEPCRGIWQGYRRGGTLSREGCAARSGREYLPHSSQRT